MTARDRDMRRIRIMSLLQAGYSYESIAEEVKLTRERVRQIVVKSLTSGLSGARIDPRLVQCARLEPALRLAASKVAEGDLAGIDRLIKVLDKLDKYGPIAVTGVYDDRRAQETVRQARPRGGAAVAAAAARGITVT